ncbi:MAG: hypothetical protein NC924_02695 [Candidatus Omnitrophica bacterium]|nr:hypothetical protein [Candidatus Omnitrophota bacterium]
MRAIVRGFFLSIFCIAPVCAAVPEPAFVLTEPGEEIVDYSKYGVFQGIGTENYKYKMTDPKKLAAAVGEGIFPNTTGVRNNPTYKQYMKDKKLDGSHWSFVGTHDKQADYFRWATAAEDPGVKLYFTGLALENAGHIRQAIKAYYALVVQFPSSVGITFWGTPWYVGPAAMDKIVHLTQTYPELGITLADGYIAVKNRYDDDKKNDAFVVNPGKLVQCPPDQVRGAPADLAKLKVTVEKKFGKSIQLKRFENGHWQLLVDGKPFFVNAVAYQPIMIGQSPDLGTIEDWTKMDKNANGKIDGPFDAWVDRNGNNRQDADEPAVGDFQLMKDMGVNVIRVYHHDFSANAEVFRQLYAQYGIRVMMGDYLGMYAVGSKAPWIPGTDYSDAAQQQNMLESVMNMVKTYKDEPCILMWVLGNENNYGTANNAKDRPQPYYRFVNETAKKIKEIDAAHPVAICNGDIHYLNVFAENCPDVDIFGTNAYRSKDGFGKFNFWLPIQEVADKPVIVTEYGCPAFGRGYSWPEAEEYQAEYLVNNWQDMMNNRAGHGVGNSIGGSLFEFIDEWWKAGAPPGYPDIVQDVMSRHRGPFLDGWYYEEWFGICGQGDGTDSPFMRNLRAAYFRLQSLWKEQ